MGVVPVAILSSESFDATTVDPVTVTLNGAGVKAVGKKQKLLAHVEDVNGDGLLDLLCQIDIQDLEAERGESIAVLHGNAYDGTEIAGEDSISVVK